MKKYTKISLYPVEIESCEEGGFFAECSILQGCHAEGETYVEVLENIEDVIKAHVKLRQEKGEYLSSVDINSTDKIHINLPVLLQG
jgi:predicted RNase H-like HicB family nuclease